MQQKTILDAFEQTVEQFPQKTAFADADCALTFDALFHQARAAAGLISQMTKPGDPVLVCMKKGASCLSAFLGAVYAGCFYVPVDVRMPAERIRLITDNLQPALVICDADTREKAASYIAEDRIVCYEDLIRTTPDEAQLAHIRRQMKSTDLLYVLFTSGSTGTPKGVTISHLAVMDFTTWICEKYGFDETVSLCSQAPFYFDASVPDLFIPLFTGATTFIPPASYYTFPKKVLQYIEEHNINTLIWVPSALCNVVNCKAFDVCVPAGIKTVIFCGEVMPCRQLNVWRKHIPDALYVNMYGPTEATYACTYYEIRKDFADDDVLPLGHACENSNILLFDQDRLCSPGEEGEICILGQCLSAGYYRAKEKTNEVFVQNPLNDAYTEIMYRTGDLAYTDEDGHLVFAGRRDHQIKRLGHRIELGEIEAAIRSAKEVTNGCCIFDATSGDIIAVYSGEIEDKALHTRLKDHLPDYMLPTRYVRLPEIPMNLNGKIDRVLLKETYANGS